MEETKDLVFISDQHRNDLFQGPRAKKWHFIWPLDPEDNISQFSQWTIQDLMAFINELPADYVKRRRRGFKRTEIKAENKLIISLEFELTCPENKPRIQIHINKDSTITVECNRFALNQLFQFKNECIRSSIGADGKTMKKQKLQVIYFYYKRIPHEDFKSGTHLILNNQPLINTTIYGFSNNLTYIAKHLMRYKEIITKPEFTQLDEYIDSWIPNSSIQLNSLEDLSSNISR